MQIKQSHSKIKRPCEEGAALQTEFANFNILILRLKSDNTHAD